MLNVKWAFLKKFNIPFFVYFCLGKYNLNLDTFFTHLVYQYTYILIDTIDGIYIFILCGAFNKFPEFFVQAFKIVIDSYEMTDQFL